MEKIIKKLRKVSWFIIISASILAVILTFLIITIL
jgi:type IV secretory pathway component VirB8